MAPAAARKGPIQLHDEIWGIVISHLRVSLPTPNGKNDKSAILQVDLASAMRVNKVWNNYAGPLLYKAVVTCRPKLFARHCGTDAAKALRIPGVRSKRDLVGLTQRLFLEYWTKESIVPTYPHIMLGKEVMGGPATWEFVAPTGDFVKYLILKEAQEIHEGVASLAPYMKQLRGLAVGAFLGGRKDKWPKMYKTRKEEQELMPHTMRARATVSSLLNLPNPVIFCQHVERGPLAPLPALYYPQASGGRYLQHRLHVNSLDFEIPVVFNGESKWYISVENIRGHHDIQFQKGSEMMIFLSIGLLEAREEVLQNHYFSDKMRREYTKQPAVNVEMLFPPKIARGGFREIVEQELEGCRQVSIDGLKVPKARWVGDRWKTEALAQAPDCEVCGWCSDDIPAREFDWLGNDGMEREDEHWDDDEYDNSTMGGRMRQLLHKERTPGFGPIQPMF